MLQLMERMERAEARSDGLLPCQPSYLQQALAFVDSSAGDNEQWVGRIVKRFFFL